MELSSIACRTYLPRASFRGVHGTGPGHANIHRFVADVVTSFVAIGLDAAIA